MTTMPINVRVQKHRERLVEDFAGDGRKAMTVKRDKLGSAFGRIDADAMVEVKRCLAVFLGIVK